MSYHFCVKIAYAIDNVCTYDIFLLECFIWTDGEFDMSFLEQIKKIPITDIAGKLGFTLVRRGNYFSLKEHDSTIIDVEKNCFWRNSRFSRGFKGGAGSPIDFLMEFGGETEPKKAMRRLALMYGINQGAQAGIRYTQNAEQDIRIGEMGHGRDQSLCLPVKDHDCNRVYNYLLDRSISPEIIKFFIEKKMLYQDTRKNCVFVSPARDFACIRGTDKQRKFIKDCIGNNYDACFFFKGNSGVDRLIVAESVIDIMSIMSYLQIKGISYENYAYLATSGTNKVYSLFFHVQAEQPGICKIYLCNDNDGAGREADQKAMLGLQKIGYAGVCKIEKSPGGKDWNEYLIMMEKGEIK